MMQFRLGLTALLVIGFIALGAAYGQFGVSNILKPYQWQNRLILIFTDSEENSDYQEQLESLELYPFEMADRQLELLTIFNTTGHTLSFTKTETEKQTLTQTTAQDLRNHYNISNDFTILLIGKDGSIKRRSNEVLDAWEFFDQIDTMPMRQREMSR